MINNISPTRSTARTNNSSRNFHCSPPSILLTYSLESSDIISSSSNITLTVLSQIHQQAVQIIILYNHSLFERRHLIIYSASNNDYQHNVQHVRTTTPNTETQVQGFSHPSSSNRRLSMSGLPSKDIPPGIVIRYAKECSILLSFRGMYY